MTSEDVAARAAKLAEDAIGKMQKGDHESASKLLREASSLDRSNLTVKSAWTKFHEQEGGAALVGLCQRWIDSLDDDDGEEALDFIAHHHLSIQTEEEAMEVLLAYSGDIDMADQLTEALFKTRGGRKAVAAEFTKSPTVTWNKIYDRGDSSIGGLTDLMLDPSAWSSEKDRIAAERDVFQLALAWMMKAGLDYPERPLTAISRMLGAEAANLRGLIDADGFDVLLSSLDIKLDKAIRGHATIATAKLLELSPDTARALISQYLVKRVQKPTAESLIQAFSAAAAVFPMAPEAAAELFLHAGFLEVFVKLVSKWKSHRLEQAALELLSAACQDRACREAIRKYCLDWLKALAECNGNALEQRRASQANLILMKIKDAVPEGEQNTKSKRDSAVAQAQLVGRFKKMIVLDSKDADPVARQNAIEGLAYASIDPAVKDELANNPAFLKSIVEFMNRMSSSASAQPSLFGALSILTNLTAYRPVLSEEQRKLSELKSYANTTTPQPPNPLDEDSAVTSRCTKVLSSSVVSVLSKLSRSLSPTSRALTTALLLSLSKHPPHRGSLAQQGAIKLLLTLHAPSNTPSPIPSVATTAAAHALARILISTNPHHTFPSSGPPAESTIRPLVTLLTPDAPGFGPTSPSTPPTLLPTFESLLALTNLASLPSASVHSILLSHAFPPTFDLLLSHNDMVRRAAAELVCNLCATPAGAAKFDVRERGCTQRLRVLLALCDVEDEQTRRAAGGAVAMIVSGERDVPRAWFGTTVGAKMEAGGEEEGVGEKVVRTAVGMCDDDDPEVVMRGVVVMQGLVGIEGDEGKRAKELLVRNKAVEVLEELQQENMVGEMVGEVLRVLRKT